MKLEFTIIGGIVTLAGIAALTRYKAFSRDSRKFQEHIFGIKMKRFPFEAGTVVAGIAACIIGGYIIFMSLQ